MCDLSLSLCVFTPQAKIYTEWVAMGWWSHKIILHSLRRRGASSVYFAQQKNISQFTLILDVWNCNLYNWLYLYVYGKLIIVYVRTIMRHGTCYRSESVLNKLGFHFVLYYQRFTKYTLSKGKREKERWRSKGIIHVCIEIDVFRWVCQHGKTKNLKGTHKVFVCVFKGSKNWNYSIIERFFD